ncbi:hypothetical protein KUCAC02_029769 [Chaenocephalus aceratus]|nr:hypothetical protein KUCAC02_029769 [Chaenocephalus aceratus]
MEETKPEVRAHPPPAALTAVYSKVEEEKENAGGGKTACLLKGHVESTAQEGREEAEQSAGEGPSGKRQPAGGEHHGEGRGGGKDEGTTEGKERGERKRRTWKGKGGEEEGGDVFRVDYTLKVFGGWKCQADGGGCGGGYAGAVWQSDGVQDERREGT